jgi:GH24 family phage-related lysozyme (muramidase)
MSREKLHKVIADMNLQQEGFFNKLVAGTALAASLAAGTPASHAVANASKSTNSTPALITKWEGLRDKAYKDSNGNVTIGVGHFLSGTEQDRKLIRSLFGDAIDYDQLIQGKTKLSKSQIDKLLQADIKVKETLARKLIPTFDKLNVAAQQAIVNALFRGDLGKKTIALINKNKFKEAAVEYLKHPNFKSGPKQIQDRMRSNSLAIAAANIINTKPVK